MLQEIIMLIYVHKINHILINIKYLINVKVNVQMMQNITLIMIMIIQNNVMIVVK